jgi:hypothetical protein
MREAGMRAEAEQRERSVSDWPVVYNEGSREIRVSPSGIVVVEDRLPDGQIRHTRVYSDGRYAQVIESTPQKAWLAARKQAT